MDAVLIKKSVYMQLNSLLLLMKNVSRQQWNQFKVPF